MCTQDYRIYTCGCKKSEEFHQCQQRRGTNVKCTPVVQGELRSSPHMCSGHMVKPSAPVHYRRDGEGSSNG